MTYLLLVIPTIALAWIGAAIALDAYGRRKAPGGTFDAIVVPGCRVKPDGRPSSALMRRTRHAVELWRAGVAPRIVLTGGLGEHPPTEAQAAAIYAEELGVPTSALIREDRSTTTDENARFAAELVPDARVLVTTDAYHVYRCQRLFRRYFPDACAVGSTPGRRLRVRGSLREVVSVLMSWWR